MVPNSGLQVIVLVVSCLYMITCGCSGSDKQRDYENWISWNLKNYQKATFSKTKWNNNNVAAVSGGDLKLGMAEMNKVRISVRQDGTGDFNTTKQALDTIPLHNTRRVQVLIGPGVYR